MAQISVYLNPHASQAEHSFHAEELKKYFFRHQLQFKTPGSELELIHHIKQDRDLGVDCIFSIGGDGTAHTIAQNLIGSRTKLLVLPAGTANDFAAELGTNSNLKKLASIFHSQNTKLVDIIKVNDRYLMTNGGIGIAYNVAQKVNKVRKETPLFKTFMKTAGKNAYSFVFVKELMLTKFELQDVYIESPDFPLLEKRVKSPLILVNNQSKLAGKFPVAPQTKNDDGKFNVTIFMHDNLMDFVKSSSSFLRSQFPEADRRILQFETDQLSLISLTNKHLHFFGDGENFEPSKELNISIIPKGLEVFSQNDNLVLCPSYSLDTIPTIQ
jgi:diacylglycerol kinase family enzyme